MLCIAFLEASDVPRRSAGEQLGLADEEDQFDPTADRVDREPPHLERWCVGGHVRSPTRFSWRRETWTARVRKRGMLRALLPGMLFIFMACGGSNADATGSAGSGAETDLGTGGGDSGGGAAGGAQGSGGQQDVGGGPPLGPEFCPTGAAVNGVGIDVGQRLPEIMVKRCDGSDVSLSDFCGAEGLWIFAAHGWCPLCQSVSRNQESLHDEFAGRGLVTLNIVMETASLEAPGPEFCALWRSEHGHEDVVTLFDPTGATLALWPGGSSSLSAFVDADRTITGKLVHDSNLTTIRAGIEESLKP